MFGYFGLYVVAVFGSPCLFLLLVSIIKRTHRNLNTSTQTICGVVVYSLLALLSR